MESNKFINKLDYRPMGVCHKTYIWIKCFCYAVRTEIQRICVRAVYVVSILFLEYVIYYSSRKSAVGIATGYMLDDGGIGVRVPVGSRIFYSAASRSALGPTRPPIQWVPGALPPGVKRPGREADHSPPTNAEVMKS
jgi:hypothetical protein